VIIFFQPDLTRPYILLICSARSQCSASPSGAARGVSTSALSATISGRVRLSSDVSEIKLVFSIPPHRPTPNIAPSWNVAPTGPLPVIRYDLKAGERSLDVTRWGLVPFWAKDIKTGFSNINVMAETVDTKPAFREAFERRRCLVPVDNFYEWKKTETGKQPCAIALADRAPPRDRRKDKAIGASILHSTNSRRVVRLGGSTGPDGGDCQAG
jgi:SOS response associated peptidase (SRAP)